MKIFCLAQISQSFNNFTAIDFYLRVNNNQYNGNQFLYRHPWLINQCRLRGTGTPAKFTCRLPRSYISNRHSSRVLQGSESHRIIGYRGDIPHFCWGITFIKRSVYHCISTRLCSRPTSNHGFCRLPLFLGHVQSLLTLLRSTLWSFWKKTKFGSQTAGISEIHSPSPYCYVRNSLVQ